MLFNRRFPNHKTLYHARFHQLADDLGQALGRTEEYKALKRAIGSIDEDAALADVRGDLGRLEGEIETAVRGGEEPSDEVKGQYEEAVAKLQASPTYQRLVVSQANFDKVMHKVNAVIAEGMEKGGQSRIIVP